jgi:phosphate transport system substrate-binding protein
LQRLSPAFERANPGHRLQILPSVGSSGAALAVANGALDVGISGRPLSPAEEALGVTAIAYARTPFLFAVGPRTGATGVSTAEIARIYRGELTTWPNGERVRLVLRPRTDVDTALLRAISPEMSAAVDLASTREGLLVAVTNQECDEILARTPGSIGPTSLSEILTDEEKLVPLAWNGVAPSVANLASGAYPLAKTLSVLTRVPPSSAVRRFLSFLASPEARDILEKTGNLPLAMGPAAGNVDADRRP